MTASRPHRGRAAVLPASDLRLLALRLSPGEDLKDALSAAFAEAAAPSGFVLSCVGSLSAARLRYAGREDAAATRGPTEIVSLSGTLSTDGCHLHASLSDADGRVIGGHLVPGCIVRTTAEVVIGLGDAVRFARRLDPETGYPELVIGPAARDRAPSAASAVSNQGQPV